jgi:glycine oxidase
MKSVIIVGAGVVGLFCAVRLAKAGARVTVLEAEQEDLSVYGPGASAAAAGMLAPLGDAPSPHDALTYASYDLWKGWREGAPWADGVRLDGGVFIAANADEARAMTERAAGLRRAAEPVSASQFRKRTGLRANPEHAVFIEDEGVADPLRVLSGLMMQARAHGVIIAFGREVATVTGATARTYEEDAVYEADAVVLACGYWGCKRLAEFAPALRHVTPAKGHLAPIALDKPLWPNLRAPGFYIAQRREDVVLGATLEPGRFDRRVEQAHIDELFAAASLVLPSEVQPAGRGWAGVRPMSPDGWPMIGPSGEVLIAAGHSRNGWLLAPITAEIVSAYVFGAEIPPEWATLSPQRFETP